MSQPDKIEVAVRTVLREHLGLTYEQAESIDDDTHIVNDLGADSLDVIEVFMAIEDELDIKLPDTANDTCHTFGDAMALVRSKTGMVC